MQSLLTGEEFSPDEIKALLASAKELKQMRASGKFPQVLQGQHLAMLFEKPSLRTRFSFTVAMRELGGDIVESVSETRKKEDPEDTARVLAGYCNGIMVRTHSDTTLTRMQKVSPVPIINGLSDFHHPCQILADLLTLQEVFGDLEGLHLAYIGDGNNILHSLLLLAPQLGVHVHYCCPLGREPDQEIAQRASAKGAMTAHLSPASAVQKVHAVYTDVWTSMGFEDTTDENLFAGYQINEELMEKAHAKAVFLHCLPMIRGKEVSTTLPDSPASVIFQQSENRLHVQKAILIKLLKETPL